MDVQNEINELRRKIRHHSRLYYVYDKPEISDYDFDMLMQRLKALEALQPSGILWYGKCPAEFDWNVTKIKPFQYERRHYRE